MHTHSSTCDHSHSHSPAPPPTTTATSTSTISENPSQTLRTRQAPIKEKYKSDPTSALITLSSSGTLDASSITCKLSTGKAIQEATANARIAGLHPAAGGEDAAISGELCSGDMLLDALVACAGVTLKAVATALGIPILGGRVFAEGDLDFRGTMGVDREAPVGFKKIRLGFEIEIDGASEGGRGVDEEKLEKLGKLTERYCVVLQTIAKKPELSVRLAGTHKGGDAEDGIERQIVWGQKM